MSKEPFVESVETAYDPEISKQDNIVAFRKQDEVVIAMVLPPPGKVFFSKISTEDFLRYYRKDDVPLRSSAYSGVFCLMVIVGVLGVIGVFFSPWFLSLTGLLGVFLCVHVRLVKKNRERGRAAHRIGTSPAYSISLDKPYLSSLFSQDALHRLSPSDIFTLYDLLAQKRSRKVALAGHGYLLKDAELAGDEELVERLKGDIERLREENESILQEYMGHVDMLMKVLNESRYGDMQLDLAESP